MGHSSIKVTVDVYGHLMPGANRAAVDRLDEPVRPDTEAPAGNQRATTQSTSEKSSAANS
jgi:integrase